MEKTRFSISLFAHGALLLLTGLIGACSKMTTVGNSVLAEGVLSLDIPVGGYVVNAANVQSSMLVKGRCHLDGPLGTVKIFLDGQEVGSIGDSNNAPCGNDHFEIQLTPRPWSEGIHRMYVVLLDGLGVVLSRTDDTTVLKDTNRPSNPIFISVDRAAPTGIPNPVIKLQVEEGTTVTLYPDANCSQAIASAIGDASRNANVQCQNLTPQVYNFYAQTRDLAGNASSCVSVLANYQILTSINLVQPREMVAVGLSSSAGQAGSYVFKRSSIGLDLGDYDGIVELYFEVVASNSDSVDRKVNLVDSTASLVSQIEVRGNNPVATRYRVGPFAVHRSSDTYNLALDYTTANDQLVVFAGRIIVKQTYATRTASEFVLIGDVHGRYSRTDFTNDAVFATSDQLLLAGEPSYANKLALFKLDAASQSLPVSWELEAVLSTSNGTTASNLDLYNASQGQSVVRLSTTSISPNRVTHSFGPGTASFTDQDLFDVRATTSRPNVVSAIYNAKLILRQNNLMTVSTFWRLISNGNCLAGQSDTAPETRQFIDLVNFSNPLVFWGTTLRGDLGGTVDAGAFSAGMSDSGLGTTFRLIENSTTFASSSRSYMRSGVGISDFGSGATAANLYGECTGSGSGSLGVVSGDVIVKVRNSASAI